MGMFRSRQAPQVTDPDNIEDTNVPNYVPQIPGAIVQIPTLTPPKQPKLDPILDMQPFDTLIGDAIQQRFVEAPSISQPPTQSAIDLAYGCATTLLPSTTYVNAPNGCSKYAREGMIRNGTGHGMYSWKESCLDKGLFSGWSVGGNLVISNIATGETISKVQTRPTLFANIIDITDCSGNPLYIVYENLYRLDNDKMHSCTESWWSSEKSCTGTVYLQFSITTRSGQAVAVSPYVSVFANEFSLYDANTGKRLVTFRKNGSWSPKDQCPSFEKNWYMLFTGASGLGAPDKRWIVAAFLSSISLRDEDREEKDGGVGWTACQEEAMLMVLIMLGTFAVVLAILSYLATKMHWRQHMIKFFFKLQDDILPKAMHKPSKFNVA